MDKLINEIVDYIIREVQEKSLGNGFQYIVDHADIQEKFHQVIDTKINEVIEEELYNRQEVADVELDTDGFDVVLCTDNAPNYDAEEYKEEYFYRNISE